MISWWKLLIIFYILFIAFFASFAFAKFKNNNNSNDHHYNNNSIHNINEILHVQSNTADIKPVGVATIVKYYYHHFILLIYIHIAVLLFSNIFIFVS
jgi:magnesium-transporting ATPase (P-type)